MLEPTFYCGGYFVWGYYVTRLLCGNATLWRDYYVYSSLWRGYLLEATLLKASIFGATL